MFNNKDFVFHMLGDLLSMIIVKQFLIENEHSGGRPAVIGHRQANLCFHFAGSGENLPDIAKSCDASMRRKQNSFFFKPQVAIFQLRSFHKSQTYEQSVKEAFWSQVSLD